MSVVPFSLSKFDSYYMTEYDISSDVYQEYQKGAVAFWFLVSLSNLAVLLSISRVLLRPKKIWPQLIALIFLVIFDGVCGGIYFQIRSDYLNGDESLRTTYWLLRAGSFQIQIKNVPILTFFFDPRVRAWTSRTEGLFSKRC